MTEEERFER